jgi:hypothetical protein
MAPNGLLILPLISGMGLTTAAKTGEATVKIMNRGTKKKKNNKKSNSNHKKGNSKKEKKKD